MTEVIFIVEEEPDGGFVAKGLGVSIYTQADTKEELDLNVREAVSLHYEGSPNPPKMIRLHYVRDEVLAI